MAPQPTPQRANRTNLLATALETQKVQKGMAIFTGLNARWAPGLCLRGRCPSARHTEEAGGAVAVSRQGCSRRPKNLSLLKMGNGTEP